MTQTAKYADRERQQHLIRPSAALRDNPPTSGILLLSGHRDLAGLTRRHRNSHVGSHAGSHVGSAAKNDQRGSV